MEENNYTFETVEDEYRRKWLDSVYGCGETMIIPADTYGIMTDVFSFCEEVKKIWIPARVKMIANEVFSYFGSDVIIYCEAEEEPSGWFRKETGITAYGQGADMCFDVLVNSWIGSYVYTCDSEDNIISTNKETAVVKWGCKIEDIL